MTEGDTTGGRPRLRRGTALGLGAAAVLLVGSIAGCGSAPAATPAGTAAATVELAADNLAFDRGELRVPAGAPFALRFENRESAPHNVSIRNSGPLFVGEVFSGPAERTYAVPALPGGQYEFLCDVHPDMRGVLISE